MLPTALLADPTLMVATTRRPVDRRVVGRTRRARPPRRVRWRLLAAALAVSMAVAGLAVLRVWPPLAVVMSGSMAPTIKTGDMVVLERIRGAAQIGDVVVVTVPDDVRTRYGYPAVVIHRIVRIAADGSVTTKGDARKDPDPYTVPRRIVTTKVLAAIPAGGRVVAFFSSGIGLIWLAAGIALFLLMPLLDRRRDARQREEAGVVDLRAQLLAISEGLARAEADRVAGQAALERNLEDARRESAAAREQLSAVSAAYTTHLQQLPGLIERAVADALAAALAHAVQPPAPPPPPIPRAIPAPRTGAVAASAWGAGGPPAPARVRALSWTG
jgi:signal peptidase I